jgi:cation-transporting ATPase E
VATTEDEPATLSDTGLTPAEVADRVGRGQTNDVADPTSRTYGEIIRANVFTRFNALLGTLLVAILATGEHRDALFGIVLVLNAAVGIIQESRAKHTLDQLTLVAAPKAKVRRDGTTVEVASTEVVLDDVLLLAAGDQVIVDGHVLSAVGLEIDESLLTGESDPEPKSPGDVVRSGSFVVAGYGVARATAVGRDSYAYKLREEASRFSLVRSELRDGVNTILRVVQWLMIPTAVLLVSAQIRADQSWREAVQGSVAGLVAMVPEGLVLLTSMALALGVIRLGRKRVLTQELAAVEGLARIDTLCVDKTGTLTEGSLQLDDVEVLSHEGQVSHVLAAMAAAEPNPNASLAAVAARYDHDPGWSLVDSVAFSSARKWAAASFDGHGAWYLGAPDILLGAAPGAGESTRVVERARASVQSAAERGRRVLLVAHSPSGLDGDSLPRGLEPAAVVVLEEKLRPDAPDTIAYFGEQGVTVIVISGDSPVTVGAVAERCGVPGAEHPVDARTLPLDGDGDNLTILADVLETNRVFGRVTPQQKRAMVHALQSRGHEVAMTGDGVNDTLALKDADVGVAMGSGSPAARAVARFVLLDNSFAVFPSVVAEGRRVIANVERVANLFLTKTIYAMLLALATGLAGWTFPFLPRHLTVISSLTIGIPGFFLALAPNTKRTEPGFLARVLRFAVPAGVVAAVATFGGYAEARSVNDVTTTQAQTVATIVLFCVAMWVLAILARPFNGWRAALVGSMGGAFFCVLGIPYLRDYFALDLPEPVVLFSAFGIGAVACGVLELGWQVSVRVGRGRVSGGWVSRTARSPGDQ